MISRTGEKSSEMTCGSATLSSHWRMRQPLRQAALQSSDVLGGNEMLRGFWRRNQGPKALVVATVVVASIAMTTAARADDNGAWQFACQAGKTCFTDNNQCNLSGDRMSSGIRDSFFANDYFGSGKVLNDNAGCMRNRNTVNVRVYSALNYGSPLTPCIAAGNQYVPLAYDGQLAGASSFKGC